MDQELPKEVRNATVEDASDRRDFIDGMVPNWTKDSVMRMKGMLEHLITWTYYHIQRDENHPQRQEVGEFLDPQVTLGMRDLAARTVRSSVQKQLKGVQEIHASSGAFAAILADETDSGADSRRVQSELHHVQQIAANKGAFAALRTDGTVVTWGDPEYGGDSSEVQD
eukprot:s4298_g1.t1